MQLDATHAMDNINANQYCGNWIPNEGQYQAVTATNKCNPTKGQCKPLLLLQDGIQPKDNANHYCCDYMESNQRTMQTITVVTTWNPTKGHCKPLLL